MKFSCQRAKINKITKIDLVFKRELEASNQVSNIEEVKLIIVINNFTFFMFYIFKY